MNGILHFDEIKATHKCLVGNKAWRLAKLSYQGFNVPKFFVITTNVFNSPSFYIEEEVLENFEKLSSQKVAVRSSGTCEDIQNASFAGQFGSYLKVSRVKLLESVKKCWASTTSERVLNYAKYHNISKDLIKMAVIIQQMIFAEKGGVIFTKDIFQNNDNVIIEASSGLGDNVVSGLVHPQRIVIPRKGARKLSMSGKQVLTEEEAKRLFDISSKIEKIFKMPQDIEWAIEKNKIYILQTRPITT